jgi:hypothetical protein
LPAPPVSGVNSWMGVTSIRFTITCFLLRGFGF